MLISLNWLKSFAKIPDDLTPDKFSTLLTLHTVEVDGWSRLGDQFMHIITVRILEVLPHPNADKLRIARVSTGKEEFRIVCGAPNIAADQIVPLALVGAILPGNFEIKETHIRGELSQGMLCSQKELGLGRDHEGIMILPKNTPIGKNLADAIGIDDIIYEIDNKSITNRPDLWGHIGLAREAAAFLNTTFQEPELDTSLIFQGKREIKVIIEKPDICLRYTGAIVNNISIKPSNEKIARHLISIGMQPVNNLVDIGNFVMLEFGQPMHIFDALKIQNKGDDIIVRTARKGESLEMLDGKQSELNDSDIIISDGKEIIAAAGVMGGLKSAVMGDTTEILIECANFHPTMIRRTASKLKARTESAIRFEKGLDPEMCSVALNRFLSLLKESCPEMVIVSAPVDIKNYKQEMREIKIEKKWLLDSLGVNIDNVAEILEKIKIPVVQNGDDYWVLSIPSHRRNDINIREDILEEVARLHGYNNIAPQSPVFPLKSPTTDTFLDFEKEVKTILSGAPALFEVYNYSFVGLNKLNKLNIDDSDYIKLANPLSENHVLLRQSLMPNLLETIKDNQSKQNEIGIFEIGRVFFNIDSGNYKDSFKTAHLPYQEKRLSVLVSSNNNEDILARAKSVAQYLLESFGLTCEWTVNENTRPWADKKTAARILVDGTNIGEVMELDYIVAQKNGFKHKIAGFEIELDKLAHIVLAKPATIFKDTEKFPAVIRDLALVVDKKIFYNDLRRIILNFSEVIKNATLFDVYEGKNIGDNNKSLAFRITYRTGRTLTGDEVDVMQAELLKDLKEKFSATLRQ